MASIADAMLTASPEVQDGSRAQSGKVDIIAHKLEKMDSQLRHLSSVVLGIERDVVPLMES